jgi:hypothetical protein
MKNNQSKSNRGGKREGAGRPKGKLGQTTIMLNDAILQAATEAGGKDGMVGYLRARALDTPGPFLTLMGKVLPTQVTGADGGPLEAVFKTVYESDPR